MEKSKHQDGDYSCHQIYRVLKIDCNLYNDLIPDELKYYENIFQLQNKTFCNLWDDDADEVKITRLLALELTALIVDQGDL